MKNVRQQDTGTEIQITRAQSEDILSARINQKTDFVYNAKTGELKIGEETFVTDAGIRDFSLLFDDVILEMTADCGTITDIFELPEIAEKFCNEKEWEYMEMCMSNREAGVGVELLVRSGNGELVPNRTTLPVSLVVRETT
mgnify:CR=1 FL=1